MVDINLPVLLVTALVVSLIRVHLTGYEPLPSPRTLLRKIFTVRGVIYVTIATVSAAALLVVGDTVVNSIGLVVIAALCFHFITMIYVKDWHTD
jgi:hypothetical protein